MLVERAVRPVQAGPVRKMRMREELLAHMTGIYDEELARLGDEAAARAEAVRRFGDPAELTTGLQASVDCAGRLDARIDQWFGWQPGRSAAQYALRLAGLIALIFAPLLFVGHMAAMIQRPDGPMHPSALLILRCWAAYTLATCALIFLVGFLSVKVRDSLYPIGTAARSLTRAAGYFVLMTLVTPAVTFGLSVLLAPDPLNPWEQPLRPDPVHILLCTLVGLCFPIMSVAFARRSAREAARRAEWAAIEIG